MRFGRRKPFAIPNYPLSKYLHIARNPKPIAEKVEGEYCLMLIISVARRKGSPLLIAASAGLKQMSLYYARPQHDSLLSLHSVIE